MGELKKELFDEAKILRDLILENPDLPVLILCGECAWTGEYEYNSASVCKGEIKELTSFSDRWIEMDELEEELRESLLYEDEYANMEEEEFDKIIGKRVAETEFIKTIVFWVG